LLHQTEIAMPQPVVVTGASGFIAKHILLALLVAGHTVRGTLRTPSRADEVRAALRPNLSDPAALDRLSFVTLDLDRNDGWDEAMAGAAALLHTASPFPLATPRDPGDLIRPAVEGTRRALSAAAEAGVRRVILTSSLAAILGGGDPARTTPFTETDWTDPDNPRVTAYERSKTLAERAAWDIARDRGLRLTTINPGMVLGRPLDTHTGSSVSLVARILRGRDPMLPDIAFLIADVADVAAVHARALGEPATEGQRIPVGSAKSLPLPEWARILRTAYPDRRIATRIAPRLALRLLGLFDREIRSSLDYLGFHPDLDSRAAETLLGRPLTPARDALLATAGFLLAHRLV
jgi:dihydroflavonol-4-reductase